MTALDRAHGEPMMTERERTIREVCAWLAAQGMDSRPFAYALRIMERYNLPLEPTFSEKDGIVSLEEPPQ